MLETLSTEVLEAIFDTLPVDITFVDETDTVRYYSRGEKRIFKRSPAVIGKKVQQCHPQQSIHKVNQVVSDLKSGKREVAEFWIELKGRRIYIRYFPVRDKAGKYLGVLEVSQDITDLQKITGEKRLLDME
jgi:PAS domain S-box-containing protein